jgi:hypothetical protein
MADAPKQVLRFDLLGSGVYGRRTATLPAPLPVVGDDFDWRARDYDGIRGFMLEELIARNPQRTHWTPADLEVVLVEVLAALADQLSDMADRVAQEGVLETARRPSSVRRLLRLVDYDAARAAAADGSLDIDPDAVSRAQLDAGLDRFWLDAPHEMERARRDGLLRIFDQQRMVTVADYATRIEEHPLVLRARVRSSWAGAWETLSVAVILLDTSWRLDDTIEAIPRPPAGDWDAIDAFDRRLARLKLDIEAFHVAHDLPVPDWSRSPTFRSILSGFIDAYRMAGQAVTLVDAMPVGIAIVASVTVQPTFYQSEIRLAAADVLGSAPDGFFQPGRLHLGEDVFASDVVARLMDIDGVETVHLVRFKRVGNDNPDCSDAGRIPLRGREIAICYNDPARPERGYVSLVLRGGASA